MGLVTDLLVNALGTLVPDRWTESPTIKRNQGLRKLVRADLAVRVVDGEIKGMGRGFMGGEWTVGMERLSLGNRVSLTIAIVDKSFRLPTFHEETKVFQGSRIFAAESGDYRLEIAIQKSEADWVLNFLVP